MISVDFAFETIKKHINNDIEITRFCAWRAVNHDDKIVYQELVSIDQIKDYDKIIYWGDFLHWNIYGIDWVNKTVDRNPTLTKEDALNLWYTLYFLENLVELQQKVIIFGGTIYGLNSEQLADFRYNAALTSIYKNSKMALMRDIHSANFVSQLAPLKQVTFGCDCALLLDSSTMVPQVLPATEIIIAYSFGRSGYDDKFKEIIFSIASEIYASVIDLEWLKKGASLKRLTEKLSIIKKASIVITDIYHCAINSNRESIPTICITNGSSIITSTLSDKKKEIFYFQHFMSNRLYYSEKIELLTADNVRQIINDIETSDIISSKLHNHIKKTLDMLITEINSK